MTLKVKMFEAVVLKANQTDRAGNSYSLAVAEELARQMRTRAIDARLEGDNLVVRMPAPEASTDYLGG